MENPFLVRKTTVGIYWSVLFIVSAIQAVFNTISGILPVGISVADGLVFGFLIGAFGLAIWFVTRYNNLENSSVMQICTSHLVAAVVFAISWVLSASLVTRLLVASESYSLYLKSVFTIRLVFGLIFYVVLTSIYYLFILYWNNKLKVTREIELQKQVREAQLKALKSQINPHFLFNSLNSIASLTQVDPLRAHQMVVDLSGFMRASLRNHENEMVTLSDELGTITLYLQIEKNRFGEMLDYRFEVPESCLGWRLPNLLLQPLFENAIKYGVYESLIPVVIELKAACGNEGLELTLSNDFDPEAIPQRGEGVGLQNVQDRLRIVYGSNQLMHIEKNKNRFTVRLLIPNQQMAN